MLTLDRLRAYGANTEEGMARCLNRESFYFRLVGMSAEDANFDRLSAALEKGDLKEAFEAAHALKGAWGNLALTPLYVPTAALTELLRAGRGDEENYLAEIKAQREKLRAICRDE